MPRSAREDSGETRSVRAVDRAIEILQAFSSSKPSMSVLEIQQQVPLSRPTLYRLLETLAAHGLVRSHGTPQRFSLDYCVGRLAQSWTGGLDPVRVGRPIIESLHEQTKETVGLFIARDRQHVCVLELPSPHVMSMSRGIGPMDSLARGASGKAILAFTNEKDLEAVLRTLPKGVDRNLLLEDLAAIRRDGHKIARGEIFAGAVGIAAPYFDHAGTVAGSIIVFGPDVRFDEDRIAWTARRVMESATELSAALGHAPSRGAKPGRASSPSARSKPRPGPSRRGGG